MALSAFYSFDVVAKTGSNATVVDGDPLTGLGGGPSINDSGNVAFVGRFGDGSDGVLFRADGAPIQSVSLRGTTRTYRESVQINNTNTMAAVDRVSGAPPTYFVREWVPTGPFQVIDRAGPGETFDAIFDSESISNDGRIAYIGKLSGVNTISLTRDAESITTLPSPQSYLRPMIANGGAVVARLDHDTTNLDKNPIRLLQPGLVPNETIADSSKFDSLGSAPGISDDGKIVGFYGKLFDFSARQITKDNGDVVPRPTTPGQGVFLSIPIGGVRHIVRIAGVAHNGHLDPGELNVRGDDRGQDFDFDGNYSTKGNKWEISAFDVDARVGVTVHPLGYVTVSFVGTDKLSGDKKAIFASRVNFFNSQGPTTWGATDIRAVGVEAPVLVARVGETIKDFGTVTDLRTYDPLNSQGQIAFWANSGGGEAVLRANPNSAHPYRADRFGTGQSSYPDSPHVEYVYAARPEARATRTDPRDVTQVILHATGASERGSLTELSTRTQKSVHYVISREGRVVQMVPESIGANHALNNNTTDANATDRRSIGIELIDVDRDPEQNNKTNPNWATTVQRDKLGLLVRDIGKRYPTIPMRHLAPSHSCTTGVGSGKECGFAVESYINGDALGLNEYDEGFRVSPTFVQPVVRGRQAFEILDDYKDAKQPVVSGGVVRYPDGFDSSAKGILTHGQVLNRTHGRSDPLIFNWPGFMTRVKDAIVFTLHSPANLLVTDLMGRRAGFDSASGQVVLEIPGSEYSGPGSEPQTIAVPNAPAGEYTLKVVGTGTGAYLLDVYGNNEADVSETHVAASTSLGQTTTFVVSHNTQPASSTSLGGIPAITVSNIEVRENDFGDYLVDFVVGLSSAPTLPVTVDLTTLDGTAAVADGDYAAVSGTLTFNATDPLTKKVSVVIHADLREEEHEYFSLYLTNVVNATIGSREAVATIYNDDTTISVESVQKAEGNAGPTFFDFMVGLSYPTILPVSVDYTTENGAALAPSDYPLTRGTLTFVPGEETSQAITVRVKGDLASEAYETFKVELSGEVNAKLPPDAASAVGTIVDDDTGAFYYVNDASTVGDVYTTAPGSNLNDGKSPGQPMASLTAFFTKYPALQPGDTIYVDSGYYTVVKNLVLGPQYSGIRIIGPEGSDLVKATSGSEILASQPVAYWRLGSADGGVVPDASGNGIDLTLTDNASVGQPGVSDDGALVASGKGVVATAAELPLLQPAALSLEMWMKSDKTDGGDVVGIGRFGYSGYGFLIGSGKLIFNAGYVSNPASYIETPLPHGTWTHVVGTYDGSEVRLYLNGALSGSHSYTGGISYYGLPFGISRSTDSSYKGSIDELAVYDRALTASEVVSHFAAVGFTRATLDRRNATVGTRVFELAGADSVTIANAAITGANVAVFGAPGAGSNGITLVNDDIFGNSTSGIDVGASNDGLRMVGSKVHGMFGIGVTYSGNGGLFLDNSIENNGNGIYQPGLVQSLTIENNRFIANGTPAISAYGVSVRIAGNVIVGDGLYRSDIGGVSVYAPDAARGQTAVIVENNDISLFTVGVSASGWQGLPGYGGTGGAEVVVRHNVVHDNYQTGIKLEVASAVENVVFANEFGIASNGTGDCAIVGNYVYANTGDGIRAMLGTTVVANTVHSNAVGIAGRALVFQDSFHGLVVKPFSGVIENNVAYANQDAGIIVSGADEATVYNNTVVATTGDALRITHQDWTYGTPQTPVPSVNVDVRNNVLQATAGFGIYVANDSQLGLTSDYNDIYTALTGHIGYFGGTYDALIDWSLELDLDHHSISADPRFVSSLGPDAMMGYVAATGYDGGHDNDFHLRSDSLLIDKGNPTSAFSLEPAPNGGRIDLGAFGNTPKATGTSQRLSVRRPAEGVQLVEGWSRSSFEIVLAQPPTANVAVQLTPDNQIELSTTSVTFATADWNVPRIVTIWAKDDAVIEGLHQGKVSFVTTSTDAGFQAAVVAPVIADIEDNDLALSWQNPADRLDVIPDGTIAPNDVVAVINYINAFGSRELPETSIAAAPPPYLDPSGDGFIAPNDALDVIDYINANRPAGSSGEGEAGSGSQEPGATSKEPAAAGVQEVRARRNEQADLEGAKVDAALAESALWLEEFLSSQPTGSRRGRRGWV